MAIHSDSRRQQVCDWLTANGIDPNVVSTDADMDILGDAGQRSLRCEVFVLDEDGRHVPNVRGDEPARKTCTVPLAVEPPVWWEPQIKPTREQLAQSLNIVYRERAHLVAHLAAILPSVMADDPSDPDWRIVYLDTPSGQWSWHIARSDLDLFQHVPDGQATWDGHTTQEKYQRIRTLTEAIVEQRAEPNGVEPVDPIEIGPDVFIQRYRTDQGAWSWCMRCWGHGRCDGHLALDLARRGYAERRAHDHIAEHHTDVTA